MTSTAFVHVREIGPLPRLLENAAGAGAVERIFLAEGLPTWIAYDQTGFVPFRNVIALLERAAREAGDDLFGLHLGMAMQPTDFGLWVKYVLAAPDLRSMLHRSIRALPYHVSSSSFSLRIASGFASWCVRTFESSSFGRRHHTDHIIGPMLSALRRYLGCAWSPHRIELEYARPLFWRKIEEELGAPLIFGANTNAIVFEAALLDRRALHPPPPSEAITFADVRRIVSQKPPRTPIEAAREIVRIRLMESTVDIDGAAHLLGVSARTVQRQLAEENLTYRELVEQTRMQRALDLIRESRHPITVIAFYLGYNDAASFTRAFRRWTGKPPSHFRCAAELTFEPFPAR